MTDYDTGSTWVLIPVHNRREITIQCLRHLKNTQDWEKFNVIVINDGSTDGTRKAIKADFPNVTILEGDGSLWWGGSIKKGMDYAKSQDADVFIWLNDDVLPELGSVTRLASKVHNLGDTILTTRVETISDFRDTGYLRDFSIGKLQLLSSNYSTCHIKTRFGMRLASYDDTTDIQPCDAAAGKFTALPQEVVETIGFPNDEMFPHNFCDHDYTYRAKEHGFNVGVYADISARDVGHELDSSRLSPTMTFEDVVKNTFYPSRREGYNIQTRYRNYMRFYGPPRIISYLAFVFYLLISLGVVGIKLALVVLKSDQKFAG
jgi:GT2 family glycosyltransferase